MGTLGWSPPSAQRLRASGLSGARGTAGPSLEGSKALSRGPGPAVGELEAGREWLVAGPHLRCQCPFQHGVQPHSCTARPSWAHWPLQEGGSVSRAPGCSFSVQPGERAQGAGAWGGCRSGSWLASCLGHRQAWPFWLPVCSCPVSPRLWGRAAGLTPAPDSMEPWAAFSLQPDCSGGPSGARETVSVPHRGLTGLFVPWDPEQAQLVTGPCPCCLRSRTHQHLQ